MNHAGVFTLHAEYFFSEIALWNVFFCTTNINFKRGATHAYADDLYSFLF